MEMTNSALGRPEKLCKDYYECNALVPRAETNNSQCYSGFCPQGYQYAYVNEKICAEKCDIYVLSKLGNTSKIANYTCYKDACPDHAKYRIIRSNGIECV